MNFTPLNLPMADLKISRENSVMYVWCIIRKKKLVLTPEEWVRQHLIHYLVYQKNLSIGLIASEVEIMANQQKRRCDLVVYDQDLSLRLLIECKAPQVPLSAKVVQQLIHYNNQLQVPIIAISNGLQHEIIEIDYDKNEFRKLDDFIKWK